MKGKITTLIILILFSTACNQMSSPGKEKQFENKSYVHVFFPTEEECMDSQPPDFFINCHQQVDFYENNRAEIMLSDIIWVGTYYVENKILTIEFEPNFEVPKGEIKFAILNNNTLKRISDQTTWKKLRGGSIWNH